MGTQWAPAFKNFFPSPVDLMKGLIIMVQGAREGGAWVPGEGPLSLVLGDTAPAGVGGEGSLPRVKLCPASAEKGAF